MRRFSRQNRAYQRSAAAGQAEVIERQRAVDAWFATHVRTWDDLYDSRGVTGRIYQTRQAAALRWLDGLCLDQSTRVLELGCGAGRATVALAQRGFNVVASDSVLD